MASARPELKQEIEGARPPGIHILNESDGQPQRNKKKGIRKEAGGEEEQRVASHKQTVEFTCSAKGDSNFTALSLSLLATCAPC